jgi:hypothetical protein
MYSQAMQTWPAFEAKSPPGAEHAIMLGQKGDGWQWRLIDLDGCTTASGFESTREAAMTRAWRAANPTTCAHAVAQVAGSPDRPSARRDGRPLGPPPGVTRAA